MIIIISPAKKMNVDIDSVIEPQLPLFLEDTRHLCQTLQGMEATALQKLWKCNDALAALNLQRLEDMELERNLTPAILAYEGIQYRYLAPHVMEWPQLHYLQKHLRILSGFYGVIRPFDGVTPYRLEMGTKLQVDTHKNLYEFWGSKLAQQVAAEGQWVLNLASQEYSRAIQPHLPQTIPMITCTFGERKGESIIEKGTMCKMARGQMVRWLAEEGITQLEDIKAFHQLDYIFSPEDSTQQQLVFIKETL